VIELNGVTKIFNQGAANEFCALKDISLCIETGMVNCLQGPSGSGKTTLLSLIACLSRPTLGRILLDKRPVSGLPERFMAEIRRNTFGFVFQRFNLISGLSVAGNVMIPAYPAGPVYKALVEKTAGLLTRFGLESKAETPVEHLSGGEAQRVAICRALINDPDIIIADEPTANLDSRLSLEFMDILGRLHDLGKSIILSSHDPQVYNSAVVQRKISMHDGQIVSAE